VENSKNKEMIKLIGTIFFFIFSGLLVLFVLIEAFIPNMTVKVFQFKPYTVITESMEPVINVGDMAIVTNPTANKLDKLEVGDIITFNADIDYNGTKEVVTHYIFSITENTEGERIIRTNRYGSTTPDPWILGDSDVLGVYAFRIPFLGNVANFIKSPYGIVAIVVNILVIGGIVYLVKSGKKEELVKPE